MVMNILLCGPARNPTVVSGDEELMKAALYWVPDRYGANELTAEGGELIVDCKWAYETREGGV